MSIELCVFGLFSFTFRTVKLFCWIHNKYDYLKLITNTIFDHYHNLNSKRTGFPNQGFGAYCSESKVLGTRLWLSSISMISSQN